MIDSCCDWANLKLNLGQLVPHISAVFQRPSSHLHTPTFITSLRPAAPVNFSEGSDVIDRPPAEPNPTV